MTEPVNIGSTPRSNLKATRILCMALVLGAILFAIMITVIILLNGPAITGEGQAYKLHFIPVAAGLAGLCMIQALRIYKQGITGIRNSMQPLNNKLNQYRDLLIKYMALCEAPALLSIIVFFLFGDYLVLLITGVMLLLMLIRMPQKSKMATELALNYQEQQELE